MWVFEFVFDKVYDVLCDSDGIYLLVIGVDVN